MVKRELEQVKNSLADFEKRHKMSSDDFYEKFNAGKLGDDREYIKWYAFKDTFNKLIERLKEIEKVFNSFASALMKKTRGRDGAGSGGQQELQRFVGCTLRSLQTLR